MSSNAEKNERSLWIALGLGLFFLPFSTIAALKSNSLSMWTDVASSSVYILTLVISIYAFRKSRSKQTFFYNYGFSKIESIVNMLIALFLTTMLVAVSLMIYQRISQPVQMTPSLYCLGLLVVYGAINFTMYLLTKRDAAKCQSSIMESQATIFALKFGINVIIFTSLLIAMYLPELTWSKYADPIGCFFLAGLIFKNIVDIASHSVADLLDKTIDESLKLIIIRHLAIYDKLYKGFYGFRTRRAGYKTYVELFLHFHPNISVDEMHKRIQTICSTIELDIDNSEVMIIPTDRYVSSAQF